MRRPAPLFGHLHARPDAPRFLVKIFGGFVLVAALVGVGVNLMIKKDTADLAVKADLREHVRVRFCRDWHPCQVPEIHDAAWKLGPLVDGKRTWTLSFPASRFIALERLENQKLKVSGETRYDLKGTWFYRHSKIVGSQAGRGLSVTRAWVEFELSAADAAKRLDWVEQHWYSEPVDHLRLELALCLQPGDLPPALRTRVEELRARLEKEKT